MADKERLVKSQVETAKLLKTSTNNIQALIELGKLKTIKISRVTLIPNMAIEKFINENMGSDLSQQITEWKQERKLERQSKKIEKKVVNMK